MLREVEVRRPDGVTPLLEPVRVRRREAVLVGQQRPHLPGQRIVGTGPVEQRQRGRPPGLAELADRRRLQRLQRVQQRFVGAEVAALDAAEDQVHRDEHDVDERDRRLEEVVHVAGDELAELVDEPPEPAPADEGDERAVVRRQERDREDDRHRHHQRAPDRVRDVQRPVPELRVPGDDQEHAVPDHGPDRADEEQIQSPTDIGAAEREARDVRPSDVDHRRSLSGPRANYALRRSPSSVVMSVGCTRSITTARSITQLPDVVRGSAGRT